MYTPKGVGLEGGGAFLLRRLPGVELSGSLARLGKIATVLRAGFTISSLKWTGRTRYDWIGVCKETVGKIHYFLKVSL
jgi:hypothetical protein